MPQRSPLISIVLPARNARDTVGAAIQSLLNQTLGDFELLAIDDGSCDGTRAVLEAAAATDARVRVLSGPGTGLVTALNMGLREARGSFLARMDADDLSLSTRLEASVRALEQDQSLTAVGTGVEVFRDDRPPSPSLVAYARWLSSLTSPELVYRERLIESPLCHPSVTLRRQPLLAAGGWRDGLFPEDWELWLRLLDAGHQLRCLPAVLHRWRDHDRRLTRTDARYARPRHLALKAEAIARLGAGNIVMCGAGDIGVRLARLLVERGAPVSRFLDVNPRKIGQRIHGIPVLASSALGGPTPGTHLIAAVGVHGARADLRLWLSSLGWQEDRDFTCAA